MSEEGTLLSKQAQSKRSRLLALAYLCFRFLVLPNEKSWNLEYSHLQQSL